MRVGITLLTRAGHNLWNNGIDQNVYHLATLLEAVPFVERVVLIDCGDHGTPPAGAGRLGDRFPLIPLGEACDTVDVTIEMSGSLDAEWAARFRARGGRIAFHVCGQPYFALVETTIFGHACAFGEAERCDEVWLLPKDRQFSAMMRSIHRCPIHEVPYLWSRVFLDETIEMVRAEGLEFGRRPDAHVGRGLRAAIFEPNISVGKTGTVALMVCEEALRRVPEAVERVHVLNSAHLTAQKTFAALAAGTDLHRSGRLAISARDYFARVMATGPNAVGADVVVSHQMEVQQNYLYLDALAGGYPLVHNSPLFSDVGYYYPDNDVEAGAAKLVEAWARHDDEREAYDARSRAKIATFDPTARRNRDVYARRLLALTSNERRRAAR